MLSKRVFPAATSSQASSRPGVKVLARWRRQPRENIARPHRELGWGGLVDVGRQGTNKGGSNLVVDRAARAATHKRAERARSQTLLVRLVRLPPASCGLSDRERSEHYRPAEQREPTERKHLAWGDLEILKSTQGRKVANTQILVKFGQIYPPGNGVNFERGKF